MAWRIHKAYCTCNIKRQVIPWNIWGIKLKKQSYNSQEKRWRKNSRSQQGSLKGRQGWEIGQNRGDEDAEDTTGTLCVDSSKPRPFSSRRGPRSARIQRARERGEARWGGHRFGRMKDYMSNVGKKKKHKEFGVLLVKKYRMNVEFLVTSIMMSPELREMDLAMICR